MMVILLPTTFTITILDVLERELTLKQEGDVVSPGLEERPYLMMSKRRPRKTLQVGECFRERCFDRARPRFYLVQLCFPASH